MAVLFSRFQIAVDAGDDSSLSEVLGHGAALITQTQDNKSFVGKVQVNATDAEKLIDFSSSLATGYRWAIFSDYPVLYRINGSSATQFQMASGNVRAINVGAPLPYNCVALGTSLITSLRLAPITGAQQTANVKVLIFGDPTSVYI